MTANKSLLSYESKFQKFDSLMKFRVKHILLVSSSYDSYVLEEDGQLTDLIYNEYFEFNLTVTPHVIRASTPEEAYEILEEQKIDLIIIFKRVADIDVTSFGYKVKSEFPKLPIIMLAYHERELRKMMTDDYLTVIDETFVWTGDVKILLSIIKLVEDRINIDSDTKLVGVRVIIIVEDSAKFYSSYLPLLYNEIMSQTRALMVEGLNISHKILRNRARPKILLAQNYEDGLALFKKYRKYMLAVISDFRFKINGEFDEIAGIKLVQQIRKEYPELPVLMQSSGEKNREVATQHGFGFISKRSLKLHGELREFIKANFGFGDFIFVDPDTCKPIARVSDFRSMEKTIKSIAEDSLLYHAHRNHFSNWLMARTEFDLADMLRPKKATEFETIETLRSYLIRTFRNFRHENQRGEITDFSRRQFDLQSEFVRIGGGSLGGKGRGLAYVNALLNQYKLHDFFDNVKVSVPTSVILGTDVFDEFMDKNNLMEFALSPHTDEETVAEFLRAKLPTEIVADLDALLEVIDYPLAVRSSSMLEDSHLPTFAGVYETHMLPNSNPSKRVRRQQLGQAIKTIYASTYMNNAKSYHDAANNRLEEEKMAVIIQKAVGTKFNDRFYPSFSGVALSYNYYSLENIEPEDGVVYVALGFGKTIVEGMNCLRLSPSYPNNLPQFSTVDDMLTNAQKEFFVLNVDPETSGVQIDSDGLTKLDTKDAEGDGTLYPICSTYSIENNRVYEGSSRDGVRIITFAPILKSKIFPLTDIVKFLMQLGSQGLNCPVEIEFAVKLNPDKSVPDEFYFLQIRPMIKEAQIEAVDLDLIAPECIIGRSNKTLGNFVRNNICDIIIVDPKTFDRSKTVTIATEVGKFNDMLYEDEIPFLLIGPGRWGTTERWLGIPTVWNQICGASVIMESAYGDFAPDPSFGTHFFQNLTSFQTGYFTVNEKAKNGFIDFDFIMSQQMIDRSEFVCHIKLEKPLEIHIDGRIGCGVIAVSD